MRRNTIQLLKDLFLLVAVVTGNEVMEFNINYSARERLFSGLLTTEPLFCKFLQNTSHAHVYGKFRLTNIKDVKLIYINLQMVTRTSHWSKCIRK